MILAAAVMAAKN
ncbi:hypothetical protein LINPERHAP1_LOCUS12101 [Linum perenne]